MRKSSDGGVHWSIVSDYSAGIAESLAANPLTGEVIALGYGNGLDWLTRTSTDSGLSWNLTDNFQYNGINDISIGVSTYVDNLGNTYGVGYAELSTETRSVVRKFSCQ